MTDEKPAKIKKAPATVTWREFTDEDRGGRAVRECSTPGCKTAAHSLRTTEIMGAKGSLLRKHAFCAEHTPDGVV